MKKLCTLTLLAAMVSLIPAAHATPSSSQIFGDQDEDGQPQCLAGSTIDPQTGLCNPN